MNVESELYGDMDTPLPDPKKTPYRTRECFRCSKSFYERNENRICFACTKRLNEFHFDVHTISHDGRKKK